MQLDQKCDRILRCLAFLLCDVKVAINDFLLNFEVSNTIFLVNLFEHVWIDQTCVECVVEYQVISIFCRLVFTEQMLLISDEIYAKDDSLFASSGNDKVGSICICILILQVHC